jgi:hypothetical protein
LAEGYGMIKEINARSRDVFVQLGSDETLMCVHASDSVAVIAASSGAPRP